jgi:hypothetical protein
MPTCADLFLRESITSRIQNDCGNWRLAFGVETRVSGRSRRGRTERRNAANGGFKATKKAPAPPACRPVNQLVTAELPVDRLALATRLEPVAEYPLRLWGPEVRALASSGRQYTGILQVDNIGPCGVAQAVGHCDSECGVWFVDEVGILWRDDA